MPNKIISFIDKVFIASYIIFFAIGSYFLGISSVDKDLKNSIFFLSIAIITYVHRQVGISSNKLLDDIFKQDEEIKELKSIIIGKTIIKYEKENIKLNE